MPHILITAGPTRAYLDDVRYLTNASSGRMAAAVARAAVAAGNRVTVVSGPVSVRYPKEATVLPVVTTGEMLQTCLEQLPSVHGVIATAAPCDFEPTSRVAGKMPRQRGLSLDLKPTRDVIATLARRARPGQWMVAFALEPDGNPARAFEKITAKRCDLIVLNDLSALNAASTAVSVYDRNHSLVGSRKGSKAAVARWLIRLIQQRHQNGAAS